MHVKIEPLLGFGDIKIFKEGTVLNLLNRTPGTGSSTPEDGVVTGSVSVGFGMETLPGRLVDIFNLPGFSVFFPNGTTNLSLGKIREFSKSYKSL